MSTDHFPDATKKVPAVGAPLEPPVSPQAWGPGQFVVVAAFRYCLGRQTYIVQECADWLLLHWPVIEQQVRSLIQRELERAFEHDDKVRAGNAEGYKPLGWDCDREQWARVRSLWANVGGEARLAAHQSSHTTTATPQGVASTDQLGGRVRSEKD